MFHKIPVAFEQCPAVRLLMKKPARGNGRGYSTQAFAPARQRVSRNGSNPPRPASIRWVAALLPLLLSLGATAQQPPNGLNTGAKGGGAEAAAAESIAAVQQGFLNPPADARPLMRWWWFGPAVVPAELEREILAMKAGGIGGFEIQPVYPLALDDTATGLRNLPYLSDDFLSAVSFASRIARANGMRVDMTLASGWPYGGSYVPVNQASGCLRLVAADVPPDATSLPVPALENGERLLAAFSGAGTATQYDPSQLRPATGEQSHGRISVAAAPRQRVMVFYIASRTGQQVKRAAVGANGFVLDHMDRSAVDTHLKVVGDRLMKAFGDTPPYSVFSDSLEVYGADWTDDLLSEFQRRRGYDLTPYLPELASGTGERSAELRRDWGLTLTELMDQRYLTPINEWAKAHGTRFRSQTYGLPPVSMSSNRLVELPEGEGPQWNRFSYMRWASSASHLYGRPVTSGETWTWLHSPAFRATPLDMKAEADRFFLEGENQIVGHGWPYTPPGVPEPGWAFYAAAVFNDHNPWWIVMPDVTRYMQRMSYLLRQGESANDVAVFLPDDDVYASFTLGKASLSDGMAKYVTPELMQQILGAGHNVDFIDSEAIQQVGIHYPMLILPHVERLSPKILKAIAAYVAGGGKVIAVGSAPAKSPGFQDAAEVAAQVQQLSTALFTGQQNTRIVASDADLGAALQQAIPPDMKLAAAAPEIGFIHRRLKDGDIYFVVNTGNRAVSTAASFRTAHRYAAALDTSSGEVRELGAAANAASALQIPLDFAPYESRVLVFSDTAGHGTPASRHRAAAAPARMIADLSHDWSVTFRGLSYQRDEQTPESWTDDPKTRFYSGVATYTQTLHLDGSALKDTHILVLDFGEGTPVAADPKIENGMRALLDGPIREAAVVTINGQRAGSVWRPPYTLEVTGQLHAGENSIQIEVANTAINLLAGRSPADYRLLNERYGERFVPQDMENLQPLPSGLLGPVRLLAPQ
jgi:hypothetical protein